MIPLRSRMSYADGRNYEIFDLVQCRIVRVNPVFVKHKRRKRLTSGEKVIIFNLFGL